MSKNTNRPVAAGRVAKMPSGHAVVKHTAFADAARALAAKEGISIDAAQSRLMKTPQGRKLYEGYLETTMLPTTKR